MFDSFDKRGKIKIVLLHNFFQLLNFIVLAKKGTILIFHLLLSPIGKICFLETFSKEVLETLICGVSSKSTTTKS